jgi:type IV pilus assembly protein PilN
MDGRRAGGPAKLMRISVNLASKPFVELRPLFARLRLVMATLALAAIALALIAHALQAKATASTTRMEQVTSETTRYSTLRARNESRMMQPANRAVLERAQFLNALFARKSFSWTAVMMDLERVLPAGVQVTSIEPVISKKGDVSIRLRVTGDRDKAIQLVRNLEHSARFIGPRLSGETAVSAERARALTGGGGTGSAGIGGPVGAAGPNGAAGFRPVNDPAAPTSAVEFEIFSGYNPLPEASAAEAQAEVKAGKREKPSPDQSAAPTGDQDTPQPGPSHDRRGGSR